MTHPYDVTEYASLKETARTLYENLCAVRTKIRNMEAIMITQMGTMSTIAVSFNNTTTTTNQHGIVKLQERVRRMPLSEKDLHTQLGHCLRTQITGVASDKISQFALEITKRIWATRRSKQVKSVSLKVFG